jgi:ParB family chromosome partitioning protein
VVFGHRRLRVAGELGRTVRAVVRPIDDRTHVIAQGQENSARANLSFIERALFARQLEQLGYDRDVVAFALSANAALLSKMMSVTERIPREVIGAVGPAPGVGRERWIELSLLVGKRGIERQIQDIISAESFSALTSDERFAVLYGSLNASSKPVRKTEGLRPGAAWAAQDSSVRAEFKGSGKSYSISLKSDDAARFGRFIAENLERLHGEFLTSTKTKGQ